HLPLVGDLLAGGLGARAARRMYQAPDVDELLLLHELDRRGRVPGAETPDLDTALEELRTLAAENAD
ncbi:MAG TPA: hypothetical protein VIY86_00470, partial [Pirellulaceae bacterium]